MENMKNTPKQTDPKIVGSLMSPASFHLDLKNGTKITKSNNLGEIGNGKGNDEEITIFSVLLISLF